MAEQRKISIRKILQMALTVVVSVGCIVAMVSASKIEDTKMLSSVAVHISNDKKYHFIEEREITELAITKRNIDIVHTPLAQLDIHSMEQVIRADPWVANAQVFVDNDRVLHMYVTQRVPVVRVFQQNNASFYMDSTLSIMPLSSNYVYYTSVVTNVPELKNDSAGWAMRKQIASLVRTIQTDSFWSAQISQIIVDSNGTFELLPVLGNQRILFGAATDMRDKLDNLFLFYKNVLNRIGWDRYETLDLRFHGQVIASPSLPYKGPVDKAVDKMNWINSIVETEAVNDAKDSTHIAETKAAREATLKNTPAPKPVAQAVLKPGAKPDVKATPAGNKTTLKQVAKPVAAAAAAVAVVAGAKVAAKHAAKQAAKSTAKAAPKKATKKEATKAKGKKDVKQKGKVVKGKSASKDKAKTKAKPAGKDKGKTKEKASNKDKATSKDKTKNKDKTNNKEKTTNKQATPKYVYPEKKAD